MKGLVFVENEKLVWKDIDNVTAKAGEVLIKVKAVGICGSDIHGYKGVTGRRIPSMVMGHEFSGEVAGIGAGVTTLKIGDRVAPFPVDFCGHCSFCKQGIEQLCPNRVQFGVLRVNGAMAEYICVPEKVCYKLADTVSFPEGSTIEPLAVAYRAVKKGGNLQGKNVFLVGTGTIGLMALICIKAQNPAKIFVSDMSDSRLKLAKELGADITINPGKDDVKQVISDATNGDMIHVSFEAVGLAPTCQQSLSVLCIRGTAVWIGQGRPIVDINMLDVVTRELTILGTFMYSYKEFGEAAEMLNSGKINVSRIISATAQMKDGEKWFIRLQNPEDLIKVVLVDEE